jgi:hypothetical protein
MTNFNGTSASIICQPTWSSGTSTTTGITINSTQIDKYVEFKLPKDKMPISVFVCGRMITIGLLGTDVECAYIPKTSEKQDDCAQLIFSPGVLSSISYNNRLTVSLDYEDEIYHYNIDTYYDVDMHTNNGALLVDQTLASVVPKKRNNE